VQLCAVGDRLVSVPVTPVPYLLPDADGVVTKAGRSQTRAAVTVCSGNDRFAKRLLLAGCDPAIGLLKGVVELLSGVEIIPAAASSRLALRWLKACKVHIAGTHLKDTSTGEFNLPIIRRELPDEDLIVVTFAHSEEGFVTPAGNPNRIRKPADLRDRTSESSTGNLAPAAGRCSMQSWHGPA
jgi:putative molybdopterin biosynthesis protein